MADGDWPEVLDVTLAGGDDLKKVASGHPAQAGREALVAADHDAGVERCELKSAP